jgi:TonB-linked SusC/RagA family outer membrane protein
MKKRKMHAPLIMLLFASIGFLNLSARGLAQEPRLTVSMKDVPISKVFEAIQRQTDYQFLYNDDELKGAALVSVHLKNALVSEVLEACFRNGPLKYEMNEKTILVLPKAAAPAQPGPDAAPAQRPPLLIHGTVRDEKGNPIAGVSIIVSGSQRGTTTDAEGHFSLTVQGEDNVLTFSYIGYEKQARKVGSSKEMNLTLKILDNSMNDVVVVGYGTQKKVNVLGAISVVKSEELVVTKNENVVDMLTGKVPGLRVQQMSSEPGAFNTTYDIRGYGSNATESPTPPLIIIDGVPRSSGDFSRMNPSEIDNISVLKDASAAVYGVKAANGVILVTTKRGGKNPNGKFNINYSFNQAWQQFLDVPQTVNGAQYMTLFNESLRRNFGQNAITTAPASYSDSLINAYATGQIKSTDWMKAIDRPFAPQSMHDLSMNGGSDKVNYFFDLGYQSQGSLFRTNSINYDKWNFRSNVNINFTKRLRGAVLVSGYTDKKNAPDQSVWTIFKAAENTLPIYSVYANNNPSYPQALPQGNPNPVVMTNSDLSGNNITKNNSFQGQMQLEYDVPGIPGLMAKGMYNIGYSVADNTIVNKAVNEYTYDAPSNTYAGTSLNGPSTVQRQYSTNTNTLMQLSLNYKRQFGGAHNVTGLVLYEENYSTGDNFTAQESFSLGIPYLFAGNSGDVNYRTVSQNGPGLIDQVTKSVIGRFDYNYKERYLAEFSFRRDGSSLYSPTGRWGFFPAGLVGWRLSSEPFVQSLINPKVLTDLKLRASYGKLGDDQGLNYQWVAGYNYPGPGAVINGSYVSGVANQGIPDYGLTWMVSKTLNLGMDFSLWNGLIGGSFEYFERTRTGIPATPNAQLPGTSGLTPLQANLNGDKTHGVELTLTHHQTIDRVTYNISGNIGISRNHYGFQEENPQNSEYDQYLNDLQGRNTNIWWGYKYAGQFTNYAQIYKYEANTGGGNQSITPGDYYYQDLNHDGVIDNKDKVPIAIRDIPLVNFGMSLGASWHNFDINVLLQGSANFHVQYAEQLATPLMYGGSALTEFMNRWHTVDPNANMFDPNTKWVPGYYSTTGSPVAQGSKAVMNAAYMRVKTLEIGYNISRRILNKVGIQNLRVYANSYNLATITGLKYSDPEHPGQTGDTNNGDTRVTQDWNISQGGYLYPENRTFNIGASVSF